MKPEAPTAMVTLPVSVSRMLKAGLVDNEEPEATAVFALAEMPEGVEPSGCQPIRIHGMELK